MRNIIDRKINTMKKYILMMPLLILNVYATFSQGQQLPDFKNEPMLVNKDGSVAKLEKAKSVSSTANIHGTSVDPLDNPYAASTMYINCVETKSAVRADTSTKFIVKLDEETDPETIFFLTRARVVKNTRVFYTYKTGTYAKRQERQIPIEFKRIAPGVYKIIPAHLEPASEYAFIAQFDGGKRLVAYTFGTD